jgi:DNA topoisomerase-1
MKTERKLTGSQNIQMEPSSAEGAAEYYYEVSRRPRNKRQRLFAPVGTKLTTPSGARVPPAWARVWMTTDPKSPIQAMGRDSKSRRVYLYSAEQTGRASALKFSRLKAFAKVYPSLLRKIQVDKYTSEEALVLYLISKTGFRVGSEAETRASVQAFGASTLRCSQVSINGVGVAFDFTGKKGIRVGKVIKDAFLSGSIHGRCTSAADPKIFNTSDRRIRRYLNTISGGSEFNVKDFRTYLATIVALRKIKAMPVPKNGTEFKHARREVGESVARELGNSPAIALKSYVTPEVFCSWLNGPSPPPEKPKSRTGSLISQFFRCIHYA